MYRCDLHGHTSRSDGNDSPKEYIAHAARRGMKIIAITDHDVIPPETVMSDGHEMEIVSYARTKGITLIKGIELSCETEIEDVHLVCFGCPWNAPFFSQLSSAVAKSKVDGYKKLLLALSQKGMPLDWEEILAENGRIPQEAVQKKMIFEMLAKKGYAESWKAAKLMVKNTPELKIQREKPAAADMIGEVHKLGGIVILAHPYLIADSVLYRGQGMSRAAFIEVLIEAGLDGMEARYTYDKTSYGGTMTKEEIYEEVMKRYAGRLSVISGGSDYHGDGRKGVENPREMGECGLTEEEFYRNPLLAALL